MTFTTRAKGAGLLLALLTLAAPAMAGGLDAPGTPAAGSGMPSTADIYNRLSSGAAIGVPGTFQEPAAGPTAGTGRTLADIAAKLPAPDNTHGATTSDVANGKTFWGLRTDGTWGLTNGTAAVTPASGNATAGDVLTGKTFSNSSATGVAGSMADNGAVNITPGTSAQAIPAGYHNGAGSVAGEANLVSANIKSGATVFGVAGAASVVDTAGASATAATMLAGKTAYANGALVTGTANATIRGNHYAVPVKGICAQGWGGTDCTSPCPNGLMGASCDALIMPFQGTVPTYTGSATSGTWNCVFDANTGLLWEVKLPGSGFRGTDETFTWYDDNAATNGGIAGTASGGVCATAGHCDTKRYVADVNAAALCGFTDWRMPTPSESAGIVSGYMPSIDARYFPTTHTEGYGNKLYWSAPTYSTITTLAWYITYYNGYQSVTYKSTPLLVKLVRGH